MTAIPLDRMSGRGEGATAVGGEGGEDTCAKYEQGDRLPDVGRPELQLIWDRTGATVDWLLYGGREHPADAVAPVARPGARREARREAREPPNSCPMTPPIFAQRLRARLDQYGASNWRLRSAARAARSLCCTRIAARQAAGGSSPPQFLSKHPTARVDDPDDRGTLAALGERPVDEQGMEMAPLAKRRQAIPRGGHADIHRAPVH
jgi:hypothetical protein